MLLLVYLLLFLLILLLIIIIIFIIIIIITIIANCNIKTTFIIKRKETKVLVKSKSKKDTMVHNEE